MADMNLVGHQVAKVEGVTPVYAASPKVASAVKMDNGLNYVDANKSTIAGQLESLLSGNSAYIKRAEEKGKLYSDSRGMLNSSAGAGAAYKAAVDAALPIAQGDASTYATAQARQQEGDVTSVLDANNRNAEGMLQSQRASQLQSQTQLEGNIKELLNNAGYASDMAVTKEAQRGNVEAIKLKGQIDALNEKASIAQQGALNVARDTAAAKAESALSTQQAKQTEALAATQAKYNKELTQLGLDAAKANTYATIQGTLTNTALGSINGLLNNTDITNMTGAIDVINGFLGSTALGAGVHAPNVSVSGRAVTPPLPATVAKPTGTGSVKATPVAVPTPKQTALTSGVQSMFSRAFTGGEEGR